MFPDSQMCFFSNVHIQVRETKHNRIIKDVHKKNRITKFALDGITKMIKGEFNSTNYADINNYVPKYLALGSNTYTTDVDSSVSESVEFRDTSLLGEITKNNQPIRIRLEDVKVDDTSSNNDRIIIRYRTMVTSGTVDSNTIIRELGLFTNDGKGIDGTVQLNGGLWARIVIDPVTIPANSVLDVIWEVIMASSGTGIYPTTISLYDEEQNILLPEDTISISPNMLRVISAKMESSIVKGFEHTTADFTIDDLSGALVDDGTTYYKKVFPVSNNFNLREINIEGKVSRSANIDDSGVPIFLEYNIPNESTFPNAKDINGSTTVYLNTKDITVTVVPNTPESGQYTIKYNNGTDHTIGIEVTNPTISNAEINRNILNIIKEMYYIVFLGYKTSQAVPTVVWGQPNVSVPTFEEVTYSTCHWDMYDSVDKILSFSLGYTDENITIEDGKFVIIDDTIYQNTSEEDLQLTSENTYFSNNKVNTENYTAIGILIKYSTSIAIKNVNTTLLDILLTLRGTALTGIYTETQIEFVHTTP